MRRKLAVDHLMYNCSWFAKRLQHLIVVGLSALSFLFLVFFFGYILYYSIYDYDPIRAIVGCVILYTMIHLNKSL